jgi:ubiquinone biosynthesis protein Coq4
MTDTLLVLILIFEVIRLVLYLRDSMRSKKINEGFMAQRERALDFEKQQSEDWKHIRALEIEELKELAKESDTMKEIYTDWLKQNNLTPPTAKKER